MKRVKNWMMKMIRRYSELERLKTFEERYNYLQLKGSVGRSTFGFDRYINQKFYRSNKWLQIRNQVILRDEGCDLGIIGYEIYDHIVIHHMNPVSKEDIIHGNDIVFNLDFLICTSHRTHTAIHYGDSSLLYKKPIIRRPGDTILW